jgi:hypothetical protein
MKAVKQKGNYRTLYKRFMKEGDKVICTTIHPKININIKAGVSRLRGQPAKFGTKTVATEGKYDGGAISIGVFFNTGSDITHCTAL